MITSIIVNSKFKSINPFTWNNVPKLVILTGVNGVGKSQFLEMIYNALIKTGHPNLKQRQKLPTHQVDFEIDDDEPSYQKTLYIPNTWQPGNFGSVSRSNIDGSITNFINWVRGTSNPNPVPYAYTRTKTDIETLSGKQIVELQDSEIYNYIPFDFIEQEERVSQNNHLSEIFLGYLSKRKQLMYEASMAGDINDEIKSEIDKELKEAPWEQINKAFVKYGFSYRVNHPENDTLNFQCRFSDTTHVTPPIEFSDLSSGEKMIVTFILWTYNQKISSLNNLIIMDEPDAHLHPSMCKLFLKIVSEILVQQYGVQVILTTHNPSTVALSPEGSIFIMNKSGSERIVKSTKTEALEKLTENLLLVTTSFRLVLVEDKNDCKFYETIYNELVALECVEANPPLAFKPASVKGASGGKTVVEGWVEKLNETNSQDSSLESFLHGIIDKDNNNASKKNLHVINRYSIENYLLDPVLIFATLHLNDDDKAKNIAEEVKYTKGNLCELYNEEPEALSAIAQKILAEIQPKIPTDQKDTPSPVKFVNGVEIEYPYFLLNMKGHDLFTIFQGTFGKAITRDNLIQAIAITRLIPQEIADIFITIKRSA